LNIETACFEHFAYQRGAFLQAPILCANAGLRDEFRKFRKASIEIALEIRIDFAVIRHVTLLFEEV
jgi:hypothetical protein